MFRSFKAVALLLGATSVSSSQLVDMKKELNEINQMIAEMKDENLNMAGVVVYAWNTPSLAQ